jgi:hypothetical protein
MARRVNESRNILLMGLVLVLFMVLYSSPTGRLIGEPIQTVTSLTPLPTSVYYGFESGTISPFVSSAPAWSVVLGTANSGTRSVKSASIQNGQKTEIQLAINVADTGVITFTRKVSSEKASITELGAVGDYLRFYIDGVKMDEWSGELGWTQVSYPITAGQHTFVWAYEKDASRSDGQDAAWIDDVEIKTVPVSQIVSNTSATVFSLANTVAQTVPNLVSPVAVSQDAIYVSLTWPGDPVTVISPNGNIMTITTTDSPLFPRHIAKVRFSGIVEYVRNAHTCDRVDPSIIEVIGSLSGSSVNGTWVVKNGINLIGLPASVRIESQGKIWNDVFPFSSPIQSCADGSAGGTLTTGQVKTWNWHKQNSIEYSPTNNGLIPSTLNPEESALNYKTAMNFTNSFDYDIKLAPTFSTVSRGQSTTINVEPLLVSGNARSVSLSAEDPLLPSSTLAFRGGNIESQGAYPGTGTLASLSVGSSGPVYVEYKYCYIADSNGRSAQIRTYFDGILVDHFGFHNPNTGDGTCTSGNTATYSVRRFVANRPVGLARFDYENGDYRLAIADIKISTIKPSGITFSFSPQSCVLPCSSTLTINTPSTLPTGRYYVNVVGDAGGIARRTSYELNVL